ncbi:MAG: hypothetical protein XE11_0484 [Methanomicrobiales archaeon 53_19]|nr:MAG: hypothetical protein XD88_1385 [Methanocalculus sp. 52_23]KUL04704.1 MAG: hypothetical protein XE11_0484 [Methanomicrobiales archaeon 53_19]
MEDASFTLDSGAPPILLRLDDLLDGAGCCRCWWKKWREKLLACGGLKMLQLLPSLCNCPLSFSVIWGGDLLTGMI